MNQLSRTGILATAIALTAAIAGPRITVAADAFQKISPDQLEKLLGAPDVRIYDANTPELYEKHHVPGAVFVTPSTLESRLPADRNLTLVFYCANTL